MQRFCCAHTKCPKRTQSRKRALLHDFAQHFSNEIKVTHDNHLCDAHFKTLSRKFELLSLTELSTRPPVLNADNNNNNNNGVEEFSNDNDNLNDRNNNNNDSLMRPLLQSVPILTPLSDANMNSSNSVQTNMNYLNTVQTVQTNITVNNIILNIHPTETLFVPVPIFIPAPASPPITRLTAAGRSRSTTLKDIQDKQRELTEQKRSFSAGLILPQNIKLPSPKSHNETNFHEKLALVNSYNALPLKSQKTKFLVLYGLDKMKMYNWRRQIKKWKDEKSSTPQKRKRLPGGGRRSILMAQEPEIKQWIVSLRTNTPAIAVSSRILLQYVNLKYREILKQAGLGENFVVSWHWLRGFMKRQGLSYRRRTTNKDLTSPEILNDVANYLIWLKDDRKIFDNYLKSQIWNMDETGVYWDFLPSTTIDETGKSSIPIDGSGHDRDRVTAALCCSADGDKMPPLIIFKSTAVARQNVIEKDKIAVMNEDGTSKDIVIYTTQNTNAWVTGLAMKRWMEHVFLEHDNEDEKGNNIYICDPIENDVINSDNSNNSNTVSPVMNNLNSVQTNMNNLNSVQTSMNNLNSVPPIINNTTNLFPIISQPNNVPPKLNSPNNVHPIMNNLNCVLLANNNNDNNNNSYNNTDINNNNNDNNNINNLLLPGKRSILYMDNFSAHLGNPIEQIARHNNVQCEFFPPNCTPHLQPLDHSLNASFKRSFGEHQNRWFADSGQYELTNAGNWKKAQREDMMEWVAKAWNSIKKDHIKKCWDHTLTGEKPLNNAREFLVKHPPPAVWHPPLEWPQTGKAKKKVNKKPVTEKIPVKKKQPVKEKRHVKERKKYIKKPKSEKKPRAIRKTPVARKTKKQLVINKDSIDNEFDYEQIMPIEFLTERDIRNNKIDEDIERNIQDEEIKLFYAGEPDGEEDWEEFVRDLDRYEYDREDGYKTETVEENLIPNDQLLESVISNKKRKSQRRIGYETKSGMTE